MKYNLTKNGLWGQILVYDISLVPEGITVEDIIKLYHEQGVVIYDSQSHRGGQVQPPFIVNAAQNINFTDTNNEHI